jgi:hypothetical protein
LGFDKHVEIDVAYYKHKVIEDLRRQKIVTDQTLISDHHVIMNPAYVNITDASKKDVAEKKKMLQKHAVYSIGRYGSWTYCSIEDNIIEAKKTAGIAPLFRRGSTLPKRDELETCLPLYSLIFLISSSLRPVSAWTCAME